MSANKDTSQDIWSPLPRQAKSCRQTRFKSLIGHTPCMPRLHQARNMLDLTQRMHTRLFPDLLYLQFHPPTVWQGCTVARIKNEIFKSSLSCAQGLSNSFSSHFSAVKVWRVAGPPPREKPKSLDCRIYPWMR